MSVAAMPPAEREISAHCSSVLMYDFAKASNCAFIRASRVQYSSICAGVSFSGMAAAGAVAGQQLCRPWCVQRTGVY